VKKIIAKFIWRHPTTAGALSALCAIAAGISWTATTILYAMFHGTVTLGFLIGALLLILSFAFAFIEPEKN